MTDDPTANADRSQLRQEAATWFARMRGPHAELHRAAFEQWLGLGAMHRGAYNRIAEVFAMGKLLKDQPVPRPRRRLIFVVAAVLLLCGAAVAMTLVVGTTRETPAGAIAQARLITLPGEIKRRMLNDRSIATLDSDTLLATRFDRATRLVRLERGRARFNVRHDARPFIVVAGDTRVMARGTVFDVSLGLNGVVAVTLLRGTVEVDQQKRGPQSGPLPPLVLRAGQTLIDGQLATGQNEAAVNAASGWPQGLLTFERATLAAVIAEANRYNVDKIEIRDPEVAELKVSGTFRIADAARLADRLATLFDLNLDRSVPGIIIILRRKPR